MFPSLRQRRNIQWEPFYRRSLPTEINVPVFTATPLCSMGTILSEEPADGDQCSRPYGNAVIFNGNHSIGGACRRRSMFPSLRQRRLIQWEHYNTKTVRINGCLKNLQASGSGQKNSRQRGPPADTDLLYTLLSVRPARSVIYAFRTYSPDTLHNPNIAAPQPFFPPE